MNNSPEIIVLMSYTIPYEAHLARAKLEASGIRAFVQDQYTVGMNIWYSQAIRGVKLLIQKSDEEDALRILERKETENDFQCPACKSQELEDISSRNWKSRGVISLLCFWLFGFPWLFKGHGFKCKNCGHNGKRLDFISDQSDELKG